MQPDKSTVADPATPRKGRLALLPVVLFALIVALFAFALGSGDPSKLPSALIGKPAPQITLPPMPGLREGAAGVPGFATADLATGTPTIVNFFASWCAPCVQEHPLLMELKARTGVRIAGVNYKDPDPGGRRFLGRYGNPFAMVGLDESGRSAIEWGVYGMPETFVIDGSGHIIMKHVGPLTPQIIETRILPAISAQR
jgi:cytochrome c biogenesis protein CcmG, thiol:disulfide interchange protein DsbE